MTCVGDAVVLCSAMLCDMWICYYMRLCIYVISAGLLRLFGHDSIFWPRGSGLRTARRNVFCRGRLALNDEKCVSLVNRVLAYQGT